MFEDDDEDPAALQYPDDPGDGGDSAGETGHPRHPSRQGPSIGKDGPVGAAPLGSQGGRDAARHDFIDEGDGVDDDDEIVAIVDEGDGEEPFAGDALPDEDGATAANLGARRRGRRLVKRAPGEAETRRVIGAKERLQLLDLWQRSGLSGGDFAPLVGVSKHTLYAWKRRFEAEGPGGLEDRPGRGSARRKVTDLTRRAILMLKRANPDMGCERISHLLMRGPALAASASSVAKVLHEEGYELEEVPTRPHAPPVRRFERAKPNQLWQSDLFTFVLKRQSQRVWLVAFLDDHSRFVVGYGLHASASSLLVIETLRASIGSYGTPEEILTDNGSQYVTWRGKSAFARELEKRGVRHVVARPRRPQTLGKVERFWGSLWREFLETAVLRDLGDARQRLGHYIDHYNFHRPHQALAGHVPADRFFGAESEVRRTLEARVAANALEVARDGQPVAPFYLTGQVGGRAFSVHAEGERLILTREQGGREEIELAPAAGAEAPPAAPPRPPALCPDGSPGLALPLHDTESRSRAPGSSPLDVILPPSAPPRGSAPPRAPTPSPAPSPTPTQTPPESEPETPRAGEEGAR